MIENYYKKLIEANLPVVSADDSGMARFTRALTDTERDTWIKLLGIVKTVEEMQKHIVKLLSDSNFAISADANFSSSEDVEIRQYRKELWKILKEVKTGKTINEIVIPDIPKCLK